MDSNKSEAERAAEVGKDAMFKRDWARAARFFSKSSRLYPTKEVAELLRVAEKALAGDSAPGDERRASSDGGGARANGHASTRSHDGSDDSLRQRHPSAPSTADSEASQATPEQRELVRRIRSRTNYYEILELQKEASDDEIKKAYRKLSLKVHPDKNKAPGSDEAFKLVSRAFQCLSDEELRANYDRFGHEDPQVVARQRRQQQQGTSSMYFEDGLDPNDIFNAFFFGNSGNVFRAEFGHNGFHYQRRQHARQQQHQQQQRQAQAHAASVYPLLQMIPILLLFLFMVLPSPGEVTFKLEQTSTYSHQLVTSNGQIPYYVKSVKALERDFPEESKARQHLEQQVENMYKEYFDSRCYYERVQQEQYLRWGQRRRAEAMKMPYCEEANRLTQVLGQA